MINHGRESLVMGSGHCLRLAYFARQSLLWGPNFKSKEFKVQSRGLLLGLLMTSGGANILDHPRPIEGMLLGGMAIAAGLDRSPRSFHITVKSYFIAQILLPVLRFRKPSMFGMIPWSVEAVALEVSLGPSKRKFTLFWLPLAGVHFARGLNGGGCATPRMCECQVSDRPL